MEKKKVKDGKKWKQDWVKFVSQSEKTQLTLNMNYYLVYFDEFRLFAFFRKNPFKPGNRTELAVMVLRVKDITDLNFRVPEKIFQMMIKIRYNNPEMISERFIGYTKKKIEDPDYISYNLNIDFSLEFGTEKVKNELGNEVKSLIRRLSNEVDVNDKAYYEDYTHVEMKYKLANIIESVNFKDYEENYDYRKFLSYSYLVQFENLYSKDEDTNAYFKNKLFMGKCSIHESKRYLSSKEIRSMSMGEIKFIIFCLSKPVWKFSNHEVLEYPDIFWEMTDENRIPKWMETDVLYAFKMRLLRKEVQNDMIPYHQIIDFRDLYKVDFIDCKYFAVRVSLGRMSHYEKSNFTPKELKAIEKTFHCKVFFFINAIEGYKFYTYVNALIKNQQEFYNSMKYRIHFNIDVLMDDEKYEGALNILTSIVNRYNRLKNMEINRIAEQKRDHMMKVEEDEKNYKAISDLFVEMMICYYSLQNFSKTGRKIIPIIENFQNLFFGYIKDVLSNEFSEPKMLLQAIKKDTSRHYNRLLKWNIEDRRLDLLMRYLIMNYKIKFLNQYNEIINQEVTEIFFNSETNSAHFEKIEDGVIKRMKLIQIKKEDAKPDQSQMGSNRDLEQADFQIEDDLENSDLNDIDNEYTKKHLNYNVEQIQQKMDNSLLDDELDKEIAVPLLQSKMSLNKSSRSRGKSRMSRSAISGRTSKTGKTEAKPKINYEERGILY